MDGEIAHHEREDAEVDDTGEQKHAHSADNMVKKRSLQSWVEEHLVEAPKVHCADSSRQFNLHAH
jgi:hypothetical protein